MGNVCITTIITKLLSSGSSELIQCDFENTNCCSTVITEIASSTSSASLKSIDVEIASSSLRSIDTEIK